VIPEYLKAIVWAQCKSLLHFRPRGGVGGLVIASLVMTAWYGIWTGLAVAAGVFAAEPGNRALLGSMLPRGLMFVCGYWQLAPVLAASMGASLDLRKLLVYPIPRRDLFAIEVLLRATTCPEMLLLSVGLAVGLACNRAVSMWAPLAVLGFILFNLLLSAGVRQVLERILARKRAQEILVLLLVSLCALPQLLLATGVPRPLRAVFSGPPWPFWPWAAAGRAATQASLAAWALLAGYVLVAHRFGRWQFERSLNSDGAAARSAESGAQKRWPWLERVWRWPSACFTDPLAALVEKEIRCLVRTPRFRLLFLMGFTFGLVIWLPMAFGRAHFGGSAFRDNYLTFVSAYALLLLGDVTFWNSLGLDRAAAQWYYLAPVSFRKVLIGKNVAAFSAVVAEITAVMLVCLAIRMPLEAGKVAEAYAVTLALSVYLMATGNLSSVHYPIGVPTDQSWKPASSARFRGLLFLVYPLASAPVLLAYGARWAFDSEVAFYVVLAVAAGIGIIYYGVALDSAREAAEGRREKILAALAEGAGPVRLM
jgi:ABC-2 type transport system permease protein